MEVLRAAGRDGRRRAAQHALRRRRAPRRRLREPEGDQARPHLLPHPRLRAAAHARGCRATTRPAPRSPASRLADGGLDRRRQAVCGRSISLGDTGNGFLSAIGDRPGALPPRPHRRGPVRRHLDHVRAPAQRLDRVEHRPTAVAAATARARRDAARLSRRRTASTRPPTAGCASPRSTDEHRAARCAGRSASPSVADGLAFAALEPVFRARTRGAVVRGARRRRGAVRGVEPRLRARRCSTTPR